MKYLILLGLLFGVIMWFKFSRPSTDQQSSDQSDKQPQNMVRCAHCGVHLPENDAIASGKAVYCTAAHRDLAES